MRPECLPARLQRFSIKRLRLAVTSLGLEKHTQANESGQRLRMVAPEGLAVRSQRFLKERFGFGVAALALVEHSKGSEAAHRI